MVKYLYIIYKKEVIHMEPNEYIDLTQWMQRHPRLAAIVQLSPDDSGMGKIIAESNNIAALKQQFALMDNQDSYQFIP